MYQRGTPKTLAAAIRLGIMIGPMKDITQRSELVLKDFLSQKFGAAVLEHPEAEDILMKLFNEITKEDPRVRQIPANPK